MPTPLISTVIPTYNYGHFVTAAIDSALSQTFADQEVIVVDDGSQDDTRDRLRPYMDRIRYIFQENQGLSAARNTGIEAAKGEWVALLDSDDIWHPRKLELQATIAREHTGFELVGTAHVDGFDSQWPSIEIVPDVATRIVSYAELVIRPRFGPSGVLIRRNCFDKVGMFDVNLRSSEDRDMWLRIAHRHPVILLTQPLWWYRHHNASMSKSCVRMETNDLNVLRKNFSHRDPKSNPFMLKKKAFSFSYYSSSIRYAQAGEHFHAMDRLLRSFVLWPFPYYSSEVQGAFLSRPMKFANSFIQGSKSFFQ